MLAALSVGSDKADGCLATIKGSMNDVSRHSHSAPLYGSRRQSHADCPLVIWIWVRYWTASRVPGSCPASRASFAATASVTIGEGHVPPGMFTCRPSCLCALPRSQSILENSVLPGEYHISTLAAVRNAATHLKPSCHLGRLSTSTKCSHILCLAAVARPGYGRHSD